MQAINQDLASKIALSCNILAKEGLSDQIFGHVSGRLPGEKYMHMKPRGLGFEEVRADDIIILDFEGRKLFGKLKHHSEYPIHVEIYKARPDINCVVHTHPLYCVALGASGVQLHPVGHEGVLFADINVFTEVTSLIRNHDQGEAVARCLGKSSAVLLQNHGIVVAGRNIEEATVYAILLEKAARMELLARQFGAITWSSSEETSLKSEQIYHENNVKALWDYYIRRLKK